MIEKNEDILLEGKTVVITAGNRGGGAALAKRYAKAGANLVIVAHKEQSTMPQLEVNEVSENIVASGGNAITLTVDLTDAQEIKEAINQIITHFGQIDILINNFSTFNFKNTLETTPQEFNKVMGNVFATFFFSQACIPYLLKSDNPHVINISPPLILESAQEACEHHLLFSISKYGMSFCTMGMADEFKKCGIAFNSLWQERPIATQTLTTNFDNQVFKGSNRPEIYAEAALLISLKPAKEFTGNYCIDESILLEHGIDVTQYAVDPNATPIKDIFLPGVNYDMFKSIMGQ